MSRSRHHVRRRSRGVGSTVVATTLLADLLAGGLSGCSAEGLQFRNDHRLDFESPSARAEVEVPVRVSWTMDDFDATGLDGGDEEGAGAFVVFVDRAPMPVGEDLAWVARDDEDCQRSPRCPTRKYLAEQGVLVTTKPSVLIRTLPLVADGVGNEQHYVNVVLVDGEGLRTRESAWFLPFETERREL